MVYQIVRHFNLKSNLNFFLHNALFIPKMVDIRGQTDLLLSLTKIFSSD